MQNGTVSDEYVQCKLSGTMSAGEQYTLTGFVFWNTSSFGNYKAQLVKFDGSIFTPLASTTETNINGASTSNSFSLNYTALPGDVGNDLYIRIAEGAGNNNASRDILVDYVNLAVVPEPGAIVSLVGGLGMLMGLRRRRS